MLSGARSRSALALASVRIIVQGKAALLNAWVARSPARFRLPCIVECRALSNTVIVALPYDIGVGREGKDALDSLPAKRLAEFPSRQ